ncbi:hypothetical protein BGW42_002286 [Actinomortierella wolfii]|nr:hypothetical protein BGW42_002286 [Actinomortierella wolfii]
MDTPVTSARIGFPGPNKPASLTTIARPDISILITILSLKSMVQSLSMYKPSFAMVTEDRGISWDCSDLKTYSFSSKNEDNQNPLQQAHIVANQVATIPNSSPWAQYLWKGSCFAGQLTSLGARQHQRLGQVLRSIYIDQLSLLNKTVDPTTVYFRSTDYPRTKQSAENLLAGMFANQDTEEDTGNDGNSAPSSPPVVDLHYYPTQIDTMFKNSAACPAIHHLEKKVTEGSRVLHRLTKDNIQFKRDLIRIFGVDPVLSDWNPTRPDWAAYMDVVHARICHDLPLQCEPTEDDEVEENVDDGTGAPTRKNCITQEMIERIEDNAEVYAAEMRRDAPGIDNLMRLIAGPLVNDMRQDLEDARQKGPLRFTLFSGHDDTITTVLGVLKSKDIRWPPYASNVLFELWKVPCESIQNGCNSTNDDAYFVRAFYNGEVVEATWCDLSWCPYETFLAHLNSFIPDDIFNECNPKDEF